MSDRFGKLGGGAQAAAILGGSPAIEWRAGRPNVLELLNLHDPGTGRPQTGATVTGAIFDLATGSLLWTDSLAAFKGTATGVVTDGTAAKDATELAVTGGTVGGTLLARDLFTIADAEGVYQVREALVLDSSGGGTVKLTEYGEQPGLIEATADAKALTLLSNRYRAAIPLSAGLQSRRPVRIVVTSAEGGVAGYFEGLITPR